MKNMPKMLLYKCMRQDFLEFVEAVKENGLVMTDDDGNPVDITIDSLNERGSITILSQRANVGIYWEYQNTDIPHAELLIKLNCTGLCSWIWGTNIRLGQMVKTLFEQTDIVPIPDDELFRWLEGFDHERSKEKEGPI